jgi:predicted acyl esterase
MDIAGTALVTIAAAADAPTFDLFVSLVAVDPSGECRHLSTGARRVRPGDPEELTIPVGPIAWTALPDFRVRLEVAASYFPAFDRNPHADGQPPARAPRSDYRVATIELFSILLDLPVIVDRDG